MAGSSAISFNVALAGECMVSRPFAMHDDKESMAVIDLLRNADLTYGHLEMNFADYSELTYAARGDWLGSFMMADPQVAHDLKWAGIDIMSLAHNHSMDFGEWGRRGDHQALQSGRPCRGRYGNGSGRSARAGIPRDQTRPRRAGLRPRRATSRTNGRASAKGGVRGRPGINPLRVDFKYVLEREAAEQMKAIARKLDVLREAGKSTSSVGLKGEEFSFQMPGEQSTRAVRTRSSPATSSRSRAPATSATWKAICARSTRRGSSPTSSSWRTTSTSRTASAATRRRCSCASSRAPRSTPAPMCTSAMAGTTRWASRSTRASRSSTGSAISSRSRSSSGACPTTATKAGDTTWTGCRRCIPPTTRFTPGCDGHSETWWTSALMTLEMQDGEFRQMRLHPVEMGRLARDGTIARRTGQGEHALTEGRPLIARGETAERTLDRIRRLSKNFGTEMTVDGGIGLIRF